MRLCASLLCVTVIVLNVLLPSTAAAQSTFTSQSVNLRAGPDRSFPLVTWFPPRTQVRVLGCTAGWRWCDVSARGWRGWVSSRYLANVPRGRVPVVSFSVGPYWDAHFRNRPWYASRSSWESWGTPTDEA